MLSERRSLLASAARTATVASDAINGRRFRGIRVYLDVTAASGTGGLQVKVRAALGAKRADLNSGGSAITGTGLKVYEVYPDAAAAANGVYEAVSRQLPSEFDIQVVAGDGSSYTYSVDYELLP